MSKQYRKFKKTDAVPKKTSYSYFMRAQAQHACGYGHAVATLITEVGNKDAHEVFLAMRNEIYEVHATNPRVDIKSADELDVTCFVRID